MLADSSTPEMEWWLMEKRLNEMRGLMKDTIIDDYRWCKNAGAVMIHSRA